MAKKAKLGSGSRFKSLVASIKKSGKKKGHKKMQNPAAVAAAIGRAKYGNAKMAELSAAGRKKHS